MQLAPLPVPSGAPKAFLVIALSIVLLAAQVIVLSPRGAVAQEPCGTGVCGGGLICMNCPGVPPTCARPPAECCGSAICGAGLQCFSCPASGRVCVRPPAVCCGNGICGDGLLCIQTASGPQCQSPNPPPPPGACGAFVCGGGLVCMNCPGQAPTCARPPAQCCGAAICGAGLQCFSCPASGPVCARPPAVCCGNGVCGDGLICVQTAQGPQCQAPSAPQSRPPGVLNVPLPRGHH